MDDSKAFDACEVRMSEDKDGPCPEWRTVSLIYAARALLAHEPGTETALSNDRGENFLAIVAELTRRGIDANALVRYGFIPEVVGSLVAMVTASRILPPSSDVFTSTGIDVAAWAALLEMQCGPVEITGSFERDFANVAKENLFQCIPKLVTWAISAPLEDLATLKPPSDLALPTGATNPPDEDLVTQYRWIIDRFSTTFIRDWATESLHYEYRWLHGQIAAPCPEELMHDRVIDRDQLNAEIAYRAAVPGADLRVSVDPQLRLVYKMSDHARTLVKQDRLKEAVTLLEFARSQRPHDAQTSNNLGFCLIPTQPEEALFHLTEAARAKYSPAAINVYNQMCCLVALHKARAALRLAGEYWSDQLEPIQVNGSLWRLSDLDTWELIAATDTRIEIATFAQEIARLEGLTDIAERWAERALTLQ